MRPTWAYSGSVKLPDGLTRSPSGIVGPRTALVAATKPSCIACGYKHQATGDVPSGENMGRGGPQVFIHLHESSLIDLNAGRGEVSARRYRPPSPPPRPQASPRRCPACRPWRSSSVRPPASSRTIRWSPKFSRTTMPDSRKAAATAADTSSSSVGRMRGPASKSWIREPNALKIEATCTPVAPAADDQHRRRDRGQAPRRRYGCSSTRSRELRAAGSRRPCK